MLSNERKYSAGERVFREGNQATHMMFIESGELNITYMLGDDREVTVDTLVSGDTACWSALLPPHSLTGSGVGNKGGKIIMVEAEGLRRLCEGNPEQGYAFLYEIARTLRSRLTSTRIQIAAMI
jgi:CRP-like cAMP-binding protein